MFQRTLIEEQCVLGFSDSRRVVIFLLYFDPLILLFVDK
jgi:hypothetical protein